MAGLSEFDELNEHLSNWLLRWRLTQTAPWAIRGGAAGLAAALAFSLVARARPLVPVPVLVAFSLALVLLSVSLAIGLRWFWPVDRLRAARFFDRRFELAERTGMALELAEARAPQAAPEWLVRRQLSDAVASARQVDYRQGLPMTLGRNDSLIALALLAGLAASLVLPNPMQALVERQQAVDQAVEEQVAQVEAIRESVQESEALTPEQKEAILRPLNETLQKLQEGGLTQEQAVSALTEAETELQRLADPQSLEQARGLQETGQALGQNSEGPLDSTADELQQGDLQQAAEELSNLDPSQMTPEERDALASQLEQAAQSLAASNPQLAQQLQSAADALRQGDAQAAAEALKQASETLDQTAREAALAEAAQEAADQLAQSRRAVAQAGETGQGQQAGEAQSIGQGQGQGEGQGQDQGAAALGEGPGAGTGAGRGEGNGDSQGGEAGQDPIGQDNGPGDAGEQAYEPIYSPYRLGGEGGEQVNLSGSGEPGDEVVGEGNVSLGQPGQSGVPYNQVYGVYQQAVTEAINSGRIPIGLRPIVKYYFSSLQP